MSIKMSLDLVATGHHLGQFLLHDVESHSAPRLPRLVGGDANVPPGVRLPDLPDEELGSFHLHPSRNKSQMMSMFEKCAG